RGYPPGAAARHARSAYFAHAARPTAAWLVHLRAHPAAVARFVAGQSGLAVPGAAPAGTPEPGQGRLGHLRAGAAGAVLPADRRRAAAAGERDRELASLDGGHRLDSRGGAMKPGGIWLNLRALLRPRRAERDLQEEVNFHLAMETRKLQAAGQPALGAERRAAAAFGGADRVLEECRDARGLRWLRDAGRDLRLALRRAGRQPGFALLAVATLALGIGANTALFTLVESVMLRPLPVPHPQQLVLLGDPQFNGLLSGTGSDAMPALSYSQFQMIQSQSRSLAGLAAFSSTTFDTPVSGPHGEAANAQTQMVSANYFQLLEVQPARGRFFAADEATPAA